MIRHTFHGPESCTGAIFFHRLLHVNNLRIHFFFQIFFDDSHTFDGHKSPPRRRVSTYIKYTPNTTRTDRPDSHGNPGRHSKSIFRQSTRKNKDVQRRATTYHFPIESTVLDVRVARREAKMWLAERRSENKRLPSSRRTKIKPVHPLTGKITQFSIIFFNPSTPGCAVRRGY